MDTGSAVELNINREEIRSIAERVVLLLKRLGTRSLEELHLASEVSQVHFVLALDYLVRHGAVLVWQSGEDVNEYRVILREASAQPN